MLKEIGKNQEKTEVLHLNLFKIFRRQREMAYFLIIRIYVDGILTKLNSEAKNY